MKFNFVIKLMSSFSICLLLAYSSFSQALPFDSLNWIELRYDPFKFIGGSPGLDFQVAYKARNIQLSPQLGTRIVLNALANKRNRLKYNSMNGVIFEPGLRMYRSKNRQQFIWYVSLSYQYKYEQFNGVQGRVNWNGSLQNIQYQREIVTKGYKLALGCRIFQKDEQLDHEIEFGFGKKKSWVTNNLPKGATLVNKIDWFHLFFSLFSPEYALLNRDSNIILSLSYRICFRWNRKK